MAVERTRCERETIVCYNQQDKEASCYTCDPALMRRLDKLVGEGNKEIIVLREGDDWREYEVPKKWVRVKPPARRNMTEEQRQAMAERLRVAREGRQSPESERGG